MESADRSFVREDGVVVFMFGAIDREEALRILTEEFSRHQRTNPYFRAEFRVLFPAGELRREYSYPDEVQEFLDSRVEEPFVRIYKLADRETLRVIADLIKGHPRFVDKQQKVAVTLMVPGEGYREELRNYEDLGADRMIMYVAAGGLAIGIAYGVWKYFFSGDRRPFARSAARSPEISEAPFENA